MSFEIQLHDENVLEVEFERGTASNNLSPFWILTMPLPDKTPTFTPLKVEPTEILPYQPNFC